jgi:hypothetical protein
MARVRKEAALLKQAVLGTKMSLLPAPPPATPGLLVSKELAPGQQKMFYKSLSTLIKKEIKIFLVYKEIQMGAVAKSYMRKGFLMYEEMRKYLVIYEEAVSHI